MTEPDSLHVLMVTGKVNRRVQSLHTLEMARGLMEVGHDVVVVCPSKESAATGKRYQWVPLWADSALSHPVLKSLQLGTLLGRVRDWGPDIVHIQSTEAVRAGQIVRAHLGLPAVISVYGTMHLVRGLRGMAGEGVRFVAATEAIRQELVNRGRVPKDVIRVIPSGVPERAVGPTQSWEDARRVPVIGTFGALERRSGHRYFLEAAHTVLEAGVDAEFLIIGVGPEKHALRELAGRLGIRSRISFCDPSPDVAEQLAAVDIFVMSSLDEAQRPVTLEAMMQGKPVVAFGVGTIFEAVEDNVAGLLVPKADSVRLGQAILRLVRKPDFAVRLGRRAQEVVRQRFSLRHTLQQIVALYSQVIREAQRNNEDLAG